MRKHLLYLAFLFFLAQVNAQTVVWSDNFDDLDISDWTLYDEDGDGQEWYTAQLVDSDTGEPIGTPILTSVSWVPILPLTPDNWAVSPPIDLTDATSAATLKWFVFASDPDYNLDKYGVYVGTSNNVDDLIAGGELFGEDELPVELTERTLDLSAFTGETIYVAFRHYDVSDQFRIGIDDVSVEAEMGSTGGEGSCDLSGALADPESGGLVWDRPYADGSGLSPTGEGVSYHIYGPFTVSANGDYTFSSTQDGWDGMIFIYQNSFDPTDQLTNYVAGNDDGDVADSEMTASLVTGTEYYFITTAYSPSNFGSFTNTITGSGDVICDGGSGANYCIPAFSNVTDYIVNFELEDIHNTDSGFSTGGYGDYTAMSTDLNADEIYTASITSSSGSGSHGMAVWIDFDDNGTFDDSERIGYLDGIFPSETHDISLTIPADVSGEHRLRVIYQYNTAGEDIDPCVSASYGEAEDYTVNIGDTGTGSGNTCEDAKIVTLLPYDDAGNTADYGNDYDFTDVPELAPGAVTNGTGAPEYLNGDDVVYAYTPTEDQFLNVSTTNEDGWVALWAFTGCPFDSTVGYHTNISGATRVISGLPVIAGETYYFVISSWEPTPSSTEYTIHIEAIAACEGTPEGGTATVDPTSGPSGATAHFTVSGYSTEAGITYDWEYSVNGGEWESAGTGLDDVNLIVTGEQGDEFTVRYAVTCNISGETAYSNEAVYTIDETNCTPTFTATTDFIVNFGLEDIQNNDSGQSAGGYGDFTSMSTDLNADQVYTATLTSSSGSGSHGVAVWIDFDDSGVFDDSERIGYLDGVYPDETHDISLAIPAGVSGEHRLRVIYQYNTAGEDILPCASATYGEGEDYTVNIIGGGGGFEDCGQGDETNGFETGYQIGTGTDFENADDFFVSAGNTLNVQMIELNVISAVGPVESIGFTFYNDEGGSPGSTVVESVTGLIPDEQVLIGYLGTNEVYAIYVTVDLSFTGGEDGVHYWMQPMAVAPDAQIGGYWWEMTSAGELGDPVHTRTSGGEWEADPDSFDGVFKLHCEPVEPSCHYNIIINVEPITRVDVADIDNSSDATVNGSPVLEDFTSIEGHMAPGESYEIALEGNTDGEYTDYFTVFIDWNQNGDWTDAGEMYEIGSISNSTGTDGQQATGTIAVPADAPAGATTMRVLKNYDASPTDPCFAYNYGQAEDYTIIVGEAPDTGCSQSTPSNGFENGHGYLHLLQVANDFTVAADQTFTVDNLTMNIIVTAGATIDAADIYFYKDTAGAGPGEQQGDAVEFVTPTTADMIGNLGDFEVYTVSFDIDSVELEGTPDAETTYWVGVMIYTDAEDSFWEGTSILNTDNEGYLYDADTGDWDSISSTFGSDPFDGVFEISGECTELGVSDMNSFAFSYYPNPVKDVLNIDAKKPIEHITIYNLAGQSVTQNLKAADGKVNMSGLNPGVYIFRVTLQGGQVETFKVIKK